MAKEGFWSRWSRADELEKVELVKTLTLPQRFEDEAVYIHGCATLVNSYLVDAVEFERRRIAELVHSRSQPWVDIHLCYCSADEVYSALESEV